MEKAILEQINFLRGQMRVYSAYLDDIDLKKPHPTREELIEIVNNINEDINNLFLKLKDGNGKTTKN